MTQVNNINTLTHDTLVSVVGINFFGKAHTMLVSDLTNSINQQAFNIFMANWIASLPTSLPATSGIAWNNGGTISIS